MRLLPRQRYRSSPGSQKSSSALSSSETWPHSHRAGQQFLCRLDFAVGHLPFSTALSAELACDFKASTGPFNGEFSFHFSQAGHDMEEEATRCGACVDGVSEALELHTLLVELTDYLYEMLDANGHHSPLVRRRRAAESVELPHSKGVTLQQSFPRFASPGRSGQLPLILPSKIFFATGFGRASIWSSRFDPEWRHGRSRSTWNESSGSRKSSFLEFIEKTTGFRLRHHIPGCLDPCACKGCGAV